MPPYLCAYYIIMCTPQEAQISGMATLKMTNLKLHVIKTKITCFKCISQERQSLNRYKFPCKKPIGYGAVVLVHNGERVSNKILVFFVIPYKIEINLSPYPWKNCSEASKHVNFQLQKFTISITLPKISIFLQHLHFHFFKNVT